MDIPLAVATRQSGDGPLLRRFPRARHHALLSSGRADLHVHSIWSDLPVTGGSDAHDVWYLGSALTRFAGRDAGALYRALRAGRTRVHVDWSWTLGKLPRHLGIQLRSLVRFARLPRQPRGMEPTR